MSDKNDTPKHTANFLISYFLLSKRSLKKIYGLRNSHISILRYICDSIDMNYAKRKQFSAKLYQTQIAKYSRNSERTVRDALKHLVKKRLIAYCGKSKFTIGKILSIQAMVAGRIDTGNHCRQDRYRQPLPASNSSNLTNKSKEKNHKSYEQKDKQNAHASVENQSTSFVPTGHIMKTRSPEQEELWKKARRGTGSIKH